MYDSNVKLNVFKTHLACVSVQANILADEANILACLSYNSLVVNLGCGGDLSKDHDKAGLCACLTGNLQALAIHNNHDLLCSYYF